MSRCCTEGPRTPDRGIRLGRSKLVYEEVSKSVVYMDFPGEFGVQVAACNPQFHIVTMFSLSNRHVMIVLSGRTPSRDLSVGVQP